MLAAPFSGLLGGNKVKTNAAIEYLGSATSHFQAEPLMYEEGGRPSLSSEWELEVHRRLKGEKSGIPQSDVSCLPQFLKKRQAYLDRSVELFENMFRFSFDFGRLCPRVGEFNEPLMSEYAKTAILVRLYGLEPFVTLNHFTMPKYLVKLRKDGSIDVGAWENRDVVSHFRFYIENVARFLSNKIKMRGLLAGFEVDDQFRQRVLDSGLIRYFLTINEPAVILANCYLVGNFPPYKKLRLFRMTKVLHKLREAHAAAVEILRNCLGNQRIELGIGHNWQYFEGLAGSLLHILQKHCTESFEKQECDTDFIGMHYYFRRTIPISTHEQQRRDYSDQPTFGDVFPAGVQQIMEQMHSRYPGKNLFISEIGFSDRTDLRRPYWLLETIRYILEGWNQGIPVKGILHWSLVNNFEWDYGMSQKFGLFDEAELDTKLRAESGIIRSWQAWRAAVNAVRNPTTENLKTVDLCYEIAQRQYKDIGKGASLNRQ